jgi:hypothetical protein
MGVLTSAMAALDASGGEAVVVVAGLDFLWCLSVGRTANRVSVLYLLVRCLVRPRSRLKLKSWFLCMMIMQVSLMGAVESAVRAWDLHRGDACVARVGLGMLTSLAVDMDHKVWGIPST